MNLTESRNSVTRKYPRVGAEASEMAIDWLKERYPQTLAGFDRIKSSSGRGGNAGKTRSIDFFDDNPISSRIRRAWIGVGVILVA